MQKMKYDEYLELIRDPSTDIDIIRGLVIAERGEGGLDFVIKPDPDKVEMSAIDTELENAMSAGNWLDRFRRRNDFRKKVHENPDAPVLVSEGDSWFQFPLLISDTIDHLSEKYAIWSLGAAGDTAENMVFGPREAKKTEYISALRRHKSEVKAFLFSGAGNDIIGEDPTTKKAVLHGLLKPFNGNTNDVVGHIDHAELAMRIAHLMRAYQTVINTVHQEAGLEKLPILIHGYDIPYAYPEDGNDPRDPMWADKDQWLGRAFRGRGIDDSGLRRKLLTFLIDKLYEMLNDVAVSSEHVHVVDCRGLLPNVTDWADEIHGTSDGFKKIAAQFEITLGRAFSGT